MFKRRAWLEEHGPDGGASSDSSSESSVHTQGSDDEVSSEEVSSDEQSAEQEQEENVDEVVDDKEDGIDDSVAVNDESKAGGDADGPQQSEGPELQVQELLDVWADKNCPNQIKGAAVRCVACKSLLLNAPAYRDHIQSKRHRARVKTWNDGCGEMFQLAAEASRQPEEEETHTERLQRILSAAEAAKQKQEAKAASANDKKRKRKGKKLGKRQRMALKAAAANGEGDSSEGDGDGSDGGGDDSNVEAKAPPVKQANGRKAFKQGGKSGNGPAPKKVPAAAARVMPPKNKKQRT